MLYWCCEFGFTDFKGVMGLGVLGAKLSHAPRR